MAEQIVELAPGESKQVSFEAIPHEAKTYQVSVNGLAGSFKVVAPPLFTFSDVSASLATYRDTTFYTIVFRCTITNPGSSPSTQRLDVMVKMRSYQTYDSGWTDWKQWLRSSFDLTLEPGQSTNYKWDGNVKKGPLLARRTQLCMWLEDKEDNKSAQGCVSSP